MDPMLRRLIGEDIEFETHLAKDLGRVKADQAQIEQVIFNLVVHAREAMPGGGKLILETANVEIDEPYCRCHVDVSPGLYVLFSISDTGAGMAPEEKERVFEPFFTTREKGKKTDLGLATTYGIIKQSGGAIQVSSEPGHGTTFRIYLPRIGETSGPPVKREEPISLEGSETILLVEDEESILEVAAEILREKGYRVLEASNGKDALKIAEVEGDNLHLLLTDVIMPQMNGKELADRVKILQPGIKVLFLSGYTDHAIVHQGVLDSGVDFLQKPFSLTTLLVKVKEVLVH
jgi:CheY-like chemotaxis protein